MSQTGNGRVNVILHHIVLAKNMESKISFNYNIMDTCEKEEAPLRQPGAHLDSSFEVSAGNKQWRSSASGWQSACFTNCYLIL